MGSKTEKHDRRRYLGQRLKTQGFKDEAHQIDIKPYIPDQGLIDAINLAFLLKRPLLLMGEPGCGKTRVAEAVAFELYGVDYKNYYLEWRIKSTTKAKDGLYHFDSLRKFYDIQLGVKLKSDKLGEKGSYYQPRALGKALMNTQKGKPYILLIDEIDKADIDFPNDLLNELERYDFSVSETEEPIPAPIEKPIVIITSNKEKELPAPFLRRCLYYYIKFPPKETLRKIVEANYLPPQKDQKSEEKAIENNPEKAMEEALITKAVDTFQFIRDAPQSSDKNVSTSELLDWVKVLIEYHRMDYYKEALKKWANSPTETHKIDQLPFPQTLLKDEYLWRKFKEAINKPIVTNE